MTRRRKLLFAGIAVAALAVIMVVPEVRWRLHGWAMGEPLYQGRPASYYSTRIRSSLQEPQGGVFRLKKKAISPAEVWVRQHINDGFAEMVFGDPAPFVGEAAAQLDASALAVLVALMNDPDPRVRAFAADRTEFLGPSAAPAVPTLSRLLDDEHEWIRFLAVVCLGKIGPEARPAVPKLRSLARENVTVNEDLVGFWAARSLLAIDP
jgi:HEAT repeats